MIAQPEWSYVPGRAGRSGSRTPLSGLLTYGAEYYPDRTAISDGETAYTHSELERGARRVASAMHRLGVRQRDRVVVLAEKLSLVPMLAAAIWKLGAVYVPLDASSPQSRLDRIMGPLAPTVVLGKAAKLAACQPSLPTLSFESLVDIARSDDAEPWDVPHNADEEDIAYIIFTSGSTGSPKGVMISHRSLLDYFYNHNQVLRFTPTSRVFSFSPFHFDVSIEDTLLPLSVGAFVYQFRGAPLGALVHRLVARERITHLIAVSTILSMITPAFSKPVPDLAMVMTGAEVCDPKIINQWKDCMPGTRVINAYGPTEATIVCLTHTIDVPEAGRRNAYPIGRPLEGVSIKLMGPSGEITAPGELGELWVGGSQVMTGYFADPEETHRAIVLHEGTRYYRTGDICRLNELGQVEFVGRRDEEIKIAGRRINLGEVRQAALAWPNTSAVAVGLVEINGRREIGTVIVSKQGADELERVLNYLAEQLPAYMLPSVVAWGQSVSLGATGKVDEKHLIDLLRGACLKYGAQRYVMTEAGNFVSH